MLMACMTCMATFGNGAEIGMASIQALRKAILQAPPKGRAACSAEVAGSSLRSIAGRRTAATTPQTTGSTTLASALFLPSKQGYFHPSF